MSKKTNITWHKGQLDFIRDTNEKICVSGGYRAGKSKIILWWIGQIMQKTPGTRAWIGRGVGRDLEKDTFVTLFNKTDGLWEGLGKRDKNKNTFTFANGSTAFFLPLDDPKSLRGGDCGIVFIEQAEGVKEEVFDTLTSRLTQWNKASIEDYKLRYGGQKKLNQNPRNLLFLSANPPCAWIKQRIILNNKENFHFYNWATDVNVEALGLETIEKIFEGKSQLYINRYRYSSWDDITGLVYSEYNPNFHDILPFRITDSMRIIVAIDPGYKDPTAVLFTAVDSFNNLICFDEIYETEKTASTIAEMIHRKLDLYGLKAQDLTFLIDTQANTISRTDGRKESDDYKDRGIWTESADKRLLPGIMAVKDEFVANRIKIFPNCVNLKKELGLYEWDTKEKKLNEPKDKDNHLLDTLRYIVNKRYEGNPLPEMRREFTEEEKMKYLPQFMSDYIWNYKKKTDDEDDYVTWGL